MRYRLGVLLALLVACSVAFWQLRGLSDQEKPVVLGSKTANFVHENYPYNWDLFFASVEKFHTNSTQTSFSHVYGGVVPHHLLAADLIVDFYGKLAKQEVTTVIIIGPNHEEVGNFWALTSHGAWQTPGRRVEPNVEVQKKLESLGVLREQSEIFQTEQSITSQMPYIGEFLPKAQVVPIILSAHTTAAEIEQLVEALHAVVDDKTVVVASVDFSHYLSAQEAQKYDLTTRQFMEEREYDQLLSLAGDSRYLDSAASIVSLLQLMELQQSSRMEILENTNSGFLMNKYDEPTTSYFEIVFTKEQ